MPYVVFEAAGLLKDALIREWSFLQEADLISLRQYLLQYVIQKQLQPFVRERILQVSVVTLGHQLKSDLQYLSQMWSRAVGKVFEKKLWMGVFGPETEEVRGDWTLYSEKLRGFCNNNNNNSRAAQLQVLHGSCAARLLLLLLV